MEELEALNVFIDTSIFISSNYQYGTASFNALKDAIAKGRARLLISDVTVEEIKARVNEDVSNAITAIKKARNPSKILRNLHEYQKSPIFKDINASLVEEKLIKQLEEFLSVTKAINVSVSDADTKFVFDCYFECRPPFGLGKKKNEFPDAFVLSALAFWAKKRNEDVYIISSDTDMMEIQKKQFPQLVPLPSLQKFLDKVTVHFEELAPLARHFFQVVLDEIGKDLKKQFEYLGFILIDQDGEVYDVSVNEVDVHSEFLIGLESCESEGVVKAQFELHATITFNADVSYDDLDTAIYDSEDKVLIPWRTIERTIEDSEEIQADLMLSFLKNEPHNCTILNLDLYSPKDVMVKAEEDDGWPYK
jgi:hypothetical protein